MRNAEQQGPLREHKKSLQNWGRGLHAKGKGKIKINFYLNMKHRKRQTAQAKGFLQANIEDETEVASSKY